jgi:translation initiation factor IF-1
MTKLSKFNRIFSSFILAVFIFATCTANAQQQPPPKGTLRGDGTVIAMGAGKIQVELKDGKKWVIYIPDKPEYIDVSGTAVLPWLKRGMFVSFTGLFDATGAPQTEIRDILVFQPNKDTKLGAQRDGISGANKNLFGGNPSPNAVQTARFIISGRLVNINNGKMVVAAPGFQTTVSLAKKMTIRVKSHNPSLIRVGDKVTVDAWYYASQAQFMQAKANSLKFISEKPYGYVEKPVVAEDEKPAPAEKKDDDAK